MKKINFKQPKYVLPIIALPFLCLLFYVAQSWAKGKKPSDEEVAQTAKKTAAINPTIQDPSKEIRSSNMKDKFDAYTDRYKKQKDYSAVNGLDPSGDQGTGEISSLYSDREKRRIDSITAEIKRRQDLQKNSGRFAGGGYMPTARMSGAGRGSSNPAISETDRKLQQAMAELHNSKFAKPDVERPASSSGDDEYSKQMKLFKDQMEYMKQVEKENDPEYAAKQKRLQKKGTEPDSVKVKPLPVTKTDGINQQVFNTIKANQTDLFIKAIIDENMKVYAGSRIRIRLLEDIRVGENVLKEGTYLYGLVNGFQLQRVLIKVMSVMVGDKLLPVDLKIYDNDGLEGLYVPASQFREFTKELGANSTQGIQYNNDGSSSNEIMTGVISKIFTSTTTAAAQLIKKSKAKLKYNTNVYLVPKDEK
jgi:conjugative transposon TraM protein